MNVDLLAQELRRDEDLRLKPYKDSVGKWTIGVGRNLTDSGVRLDEAMLMLSNDIAAVVSDLDLHLPWWRRLDELRQRVLANMCFNLGINRLLGFHRMLTALKDGNYADAASEMLASKWKDEVGERATRLAQEMKSGQVYA